MEEKYNEEEFESKMKEETNRINLKNLRENKKRLEGSECDDDYDEIYKADMNLTN